MVLFTVLHIQVNNLKHVFIGYIPIYSNFMQRNQISILKNQVGEVRMTKVLRDGNVLIMSNNEEQRERACRVREVGKHKV